MIKKYTCSFCKIIKDGNEDNFFPSNLKRVENTNKLAIPKCKKCALAYTALHRKTIKDRGLVRSQRTTIDNAKAVKGTLYIIGADIPDSPYKIGITVGTNVDKRKSALQTGHWLDLKLVWKSNLLERADRVEKKLHEYFKSVRIRGEWFRLSENDIKYIPELVREYEQN